MESSPRRPCWFPGAASRPPRALHQGDYFLSLTSSNSASTTSSSFALFAEASAPCLLLSLLRLSDFQQLAGSLRQRLHLRFDVRFVFAFQRRFQLAQCSFDSRFVFRRQFVARFFNLLTGAVEQMVALVTGLNQLFELTVGFRVQLRRREPFSRFLLRSGQKMP